MKLTAAARSRRVAGVLIAASVAAACSPGHGTAELHPACMPRASQMVAVPNPVPPEATVSEAERAQEAQRLRSMGFTLDAGGTVLEHPFSAPWSRRSFVVPTSWFAEGMKRLKPKGEAKVNPSDLLKDVDVIESGMRLSYGGWDKAAARGWDWDAWFDGWRAELRAAGQRPLLLEEAFAPVAKLMEFQPDNHTNIPLGLRFASGSATAFLSSKPKGPCDLSTHETGDVSLSPAELAHQPRSTHRYVDGAFVLADYVSFPAKRGAMQKIRCGGVWITTHQVWDEGRAVAPMANALAGTIETVPAHRRLSKHAVLMRLPTFSKANGELVRALLPTVKRGSEEVLLVDLRNNDGGDAAINALLPWIEWKRLKDNIWPKRRMVKSCLYDGFRWGYATVSSMGLKPPLSDQLRANLQQGLDALFAPADSCKRTVEATPESAPVIHHRFDPSSKRPPLRVVALVNRTCGSDCEMMVRILMTLPETIVVGANTYGVAEYVQPGYSVLPHTRLPFRIALGTADNYGDGRAFDGYGFDVDILLTREEQHRPEAIIELVDRLSGHAGR